MAELLIDALILPVVHVLLLVILTPLQWVGEFVLLALTLGSRGLELRPAGLPRLADFPLDLFEGSPIPGPRAARSIAVGAGLVGAGWFWLA